MILLVALTGGAIGFILAWRSPVTYSSKVSFVLEEGKSSGGGLSALAGQFGLDLGGMSSGSSILAGDNILGLLRSKRFVRATLASPYDSAHSLADKFAEVYGYHEHWQKDRDVNKIVKFPPNKLSSYDRLQDSLLMQIENDLMPYVSVSRPDKKMTFFEVGASFRDELLSKYFAERLVSFAIEFYIETKTRSQRANVARLQHRTDSIAALLSRRTYSAAAAQSSSLDINPAFSTAMVPVEVSSRDKVMVATIYAEMVKNLEIHKATLTQETPVIQVIDGADLPLVKNQKSKSTYAILGTILGFISACTLLLFWRAFKKFA